MNGASELAGERGPMEFGDVTRSLEGNPGAPILPKDEWYNPGDIPAALVPSDHPSDSRTPVPRGHIVNMANTFDKIFYIQGK